jgi:hypothetical protein
VGCSLWVWLKSTIKKKSTSGRAGEEGGLR